jgi:hypothetical protein
MIRVYFDYQCDGATCVAVAGDKFEALVGEILPTLVMPTGWVQFRDKHFCPNCRKTGVPQHMIYGDRNDAKMRRSKWKW